MLELLRKCLLLAICLTLGTAIAGDWEKISFNFDVNGITPAGNGHLYIAAGTEIVELDKAFSKVRSFSILGSGDLTSVAYLNGNLWIGDIKNHNVYRVDIAANVYYTYSLSSFADAMGTDGQYIYVSTADKSGVLAVIDPTTKSVIHNLTTTVPDPTDITWDGTSLIIIDESGGLYSVNKDTGATIKIDQLPSDNGSYSGNGTEGLYYGNGTFYVGYGAERFISYKTVSNPGSTALTGENGTFFISRLSPDRSTTSAESYIADPVDAGTGAHVLDRPLLSVMGARGIDLKLSYNSLLRSAGPVGHGWGHNFETRIQDMGNGSIVLQWSANHRNIFTLLSGTKYTSTDQAVRFDTLNKNSDGSYTLARKDLQSYQFNSTGQMIAQSNGKGQWIDFTHNNGLLSKVTDRISGANLSLSYNSSNLLSTISDGLGRQVGLTYDANQNLWKILDANSKTFTYTYDADHRVLTGLDGENILIFSNTYDAQGRIASQDDALTTNRLTSFTYQEQASPGSSDVGLIVTTVTDRIGNQRVLTHDKYYQLLSIRDELGVVRTTSAYVQGNLTSKADVNGNVTTYTYDARGNVLTLTDPKNRVTTMTYDGADNLLSVTNSAGKKVTFTYDASNRVLSTKDALNHVISYSYNSNGQLATLTDPKGGVTSYTYTAGRLQKVTNAAGESISYTYDSAGRILTVTNAAGKTSTMVYDGADNVLSVTDPLGHRQSNTYDSRHNVLTTTDPKGNTTSYTYNGNGKLTRVKNALNQITTLAYDAEDRLASVTDARGNTNTIGYDAAGRAISATDALNNSVVTVYDTVGNVSAIKDANNLTIQTNTYDPKSYVPLTVKDALLNTTTFSYDTLERIAAVQDPLKQNRAFSYDDLNRLVGVVDPRSGSSAQAFDNNGNRISQSDPNGNQTRFAYDAANRLSGVTSASGGVQSVAYTNGRISSITNARGQTATYAYYDDGRLQTVSDPVGTISYTYDANGNVTTVTEAGKTSSYAYDALNRVTQLTDGDGNVLKYTYDAVGNLTTLTYPDSKVVSYTWDAANRLNTVTDWAARVTRYSYDKNGRLVSTVRPDGSTEARSYDSAGQVLQIKDTKADGTTLISNYGFTYDAGGNVASESVLAAAPALTPSTATMTYGTDNRLLSYNGSAVSYDADGNMVNAPLAGTVSTLTFDARNRLVSAGGTSYSYDPAGNRIGVASAGQSAVKYVVNPLAPLSQVLMEKDGTGAVKAYYVYGLGLLGQQDATTSAYRVYHFDRRGSTVALTDTSGTVTDTYSYLAYGEQFAHTGGTAQPFLYNGRDGVMTDDNGLNYMRARYYNAGIKRFVNMDTLMGNLGDGMTLNRYAFVLGNPVMGVDPSGLAWLTDHLKWNDLNQVGGDASGERYEKTASLEIQGSGIPMNPLFEYTTINDTSAMSPSGNFLNDTAWLLTHSFHKEEIKTSIVPKALLKLGNGFVANVGGELSASYQMGSHATLTKGSLGVEGGAGACGTENLSGDVELFGVRVQLKGGASQGLCASGKAELFDQDGYYGGRVEGKGAAGLVGINGDLSVSVNKRYWYDFGASVYKKTHKYSGK